jgi:hypothetical protein
MVRGVAVRIDSSLGGIDWEQAKAGLVAEEPQPEFWSLVVGTWLDNDANR